MGSNEQYRDKVISSNSNELVKRVAALAVRPNNGLCVAQGKMLVAEALKANAIETVFLLEGADQAPYEGKCQIVQVSAQVMDKLAGVFADQGVVALCKLPFRQLRGYDRIVLLDGVQDPGNVGSIARTAYALGYDGLALLPGTADPANPKVLAGSKGAVFHLPVERFSSLADYRQKINLPLIGTSSEQTASLVERFDPPARFALAFGKEGAGMSAELLKSCQSVVRIEQKAFDSLNVAAAAAIVAYQLNVRRAKKVL